MHPRIDPRRKPKISHRRSRHSAFSYLEVMIVIVIVGIVAMLAMPNRSGVEREQLQAAVRIMQGDLYTLRIVAKSLREGQLLAVIMEQEVVAIAPQSPEMLEAYASAAGGNSASSFGGITAGWTQIASPLPYLASVVTMAGGGGGGTIGSGACCDPATGGCSVKLGATCVADGHDYQGDGTTCFPSNPCTPPAPTGACCGSTAGSCTNGATEADCTEGGNHYQGDGTDCLNNRCDGACCSQGACSDTGNFADPAYCVDPPVNGTFHYGSTCADAPCGPLGACCKNNAPLCTDDFTEEYCTGSYGGDFWTLGGTCAGNACANAPGACCIGGGLCWDATEGMNEADCNLISGTFLGINTTCDPSFCNLGACCIVGINCTQTSEGDCSGSFLGADEPCPPFACIPPDAPPTEAEAPNYPVDPNDTGHPPFPPYPGTANMPYETPEETVVNIGTGDIDPATTTTIEPNAYGCGILDIAGGSPYGFELLPRPGMGDWLRNFSEMPGLNMVTVSAGFNSPSGSLLIDRQGGIMQEVTFTFTAGDLALNGTVLRSGKIAYVIE